MTADMSHRHADSSSNLTAEDAEERRDARSLGVSLSPLRFVTCRKSHGLNTDETRITDEDCEQEQTEETEENVPSRFRLFSPLSPVGSVSIRGSFCLLLPFLRVFAPLRDPFVRSESFAAAGTGLDGEFGVRRKLAQQVEGPVEFAPAGDGECLELDLPHPRGDGPQLPLHVFQPINRLVDFVRRDGSHPRHPA